MLRAGRALGVAAICASAIFIHNSARAEMVFGVTQQDILLTWDSSSPNAIQSGIAITGLAQNETIQGIDFRPATGQLYAIGSHSNLYVINPATGAATQVNGGANNPLNPPLNGSNFGFDFNPDVDLIRITSNADQNLSVNPITGAVAAIDTSLAYAAGDANFGVNPNVTHSAYRNAIIGGPPTTLFGIDAGLDVLVIQNPASAGQLTTVGLLGINIAEDGGFDISSVSTMAYAALRPTNQSVSYFYAINLSTGQANLLGQIGGGVNIRAMTVAIPGPSALVALAFGVMFVGRRRRA
jgi:hypothetical protein